MAETEVVELSDIAGRRGSFTRALEDQPAPEAEHQSKFVSPGPPLYVLPASTPDPPPATEITDGGSKSASTADVMGKAGDILKNPIVWISCLVAVGVVALLIVILVPLHFADLDYWQIGFSMQQSTGQVSTERVYGPGGRYGLGVDFKFKAFPADAHYAQLSNVAIFSADSLELFLNMRFQYFIRPMELQPLHDAYDLQYNDIILSRAETVIKQSTLNFTTLQYFMERETVESFIGQQLFVDLAGKYCCDSYCSGDLFSRGYVVPSIECSECSLNCTNRRFFVDARYFQLLDVTIPSDVSSRYLDAIVVRENAEEEQFDQETTVVSLEIERTVQQIMNEALEVERAAEANATLIRAIASANATAVVETARTLGLSLIYERLNITQGEHKASLDYIRTLRRASTNARLHVGFDNTISGPN